MGLGKIRLRRLIKIGFADNADIPAMNMGLAVGIAKIHGCQIVARHPVREQGAGQLLLCQYVQGGGTQEKCRSRQQCSKLFSHGSSSFNRSLL